MSGYVIRYDKLWWVVVTSWVCLSWVVVISPRQWGQTGASLYCTCHTKPSRGPTQQPPGGFVYGEKNSLLSLPCDSAASRAAAKTRRSLYCACHREPTRGPAAPTGAEASRRDVVNWTWGAKDSQETAPLWGGLCNAPAMRKTTRKLSVVPLRHDSQPRLMRAAAPPERFLWVSEEDEWRWVGDWVIDWASSVLTECVTRWVSQSGFLVGVGGWLSKLVKDSILTECVKRWVSQWGFWWGWVGDWVS